MPRQPAILLLVTVTMSVGSGGAPAVAGPAEASNPRHRSPTGATNAALMVHVEGLPAPYGQEGRVRRSQLVPHDTDAAVFETFVSSHPFRALFVHHRPPRDKVYVDQSGIYVNGDPIAPSREGPLSSVVERWVQHYLEGFASCTRTPNRAPSSVGLSDHGLRASAWTRIDCSVHDGPVFVVYGYPRGPDSTPEITRAQLRVAGSLLNVEFGAAATNIDPPTHYLTPAVERPRPDGPPVPIPPRSAYSTSDPRAAARDEAMRRYFGVGD